MLIISSFSDYYDGVASSGVDKTIRYDRKTFQVQAYSPFGVNQQIPTNLWGNDYDLRNVDVPACYFEILGFCGKYVVSTRIDEKYYFGESILDVDWSIHKSYFRYSPRQAVAELIRKFHDRADDILFQQFQVPVFVVPLLSYGNRSKLEMIDPPLVPFTLNPRLQERQFQKYKDAYSAFQEIQSYISGVLGMAAQGTVEREHVSLAMSNHIQVHEGWGFQSDHLNKRSGGLKLVKHLSNSIEHRKFEYAD